MSLPSILFLLFLGFVVALPLLIVAWLAKSPYLPPELPPPSVRAPAILSRIPPLRAEKEFVPPGERKGWFVLVRGNLTVPGFSRVPTSLVVLGKLILGEGSVISGCVYAKEAKLEKSSRVEGCLIVEESAFLGESSAVLGFVDAGGKLTVCEGSIIAGSAKAPSCEIKKGAFVGKLLS